jgi:predicted anti-sigma-YlaC factor YlaD
MSVVVPMDHDEHAAVQALLPWYARGRLAEAEQAEVQRHLLQCAACRAELAAEAPLQTLMGAAGAEPPAGDVEAGLARMHALMRRQEAPAPRAPRWMPWALGLQGAALAVVLGLLLMPRHDAPAYEGLSAAGSAPVAADALVMFKPGTSEQAVRELLKAQRAGVVAGPTETGAWLLRIEPRGLAALRTAPIVALAEPLQPGPGR